MPRSSVFFNFIPVIQQTNLKLKLSENNFTRINNIYKYMQTCTIVKKKIRNTHFNIHKLIEISLLAQNAIP